MGTVTGATGATVAHVHETTVVAPAYELTPPHPPREETPEYQRAHTFLIHTQKRGCLICGVNVDTLGDATRNRFGAKQLESHHYPLERSLIDALDPVKVHKAFPQVYDRATLEAFVDSPANLIVLCDVHHRSVEWGIHHLLVQEWSVLPYLLDGYTLVATTKDAARLLAADEALVQRDGVEAAVAHEMATPSRAPRVPTVRKVNVSTVKGGGAVSLLAGRKAREARAARRAAPAASRPQPTTKAA